MTKLSFNADLLGDFMTKLAFVNKKLEKYGLPLVRIEHLDSVKHINDLGNAEKWSEITLVGPETVKTGNEFVGTISFKDGVKQIFTIAGEDVVLGAIPDAQLTCDHCKVNRRRVKYFFFREEGKLVSIGSSCAKDYFGWDIERYLDMFTYLAEYAGELSEEGLGGGRRSSSIFLNDVILATYIATSEWKAAWVSKEKAEMNDTGSTGQYIFGVLYPAPVDTALIRQKAAVAAALPEGFYENVQAKLLAQFGNLDPSSDFEFNVFNNLFMGKGDLREFVVSPGIVGYAIHSVMHEKIESDASVSSFVGTVGEKVTFKATILEVKEIQTQFGASLLIIMADENGNQLKSFSTAQFAYDAVVGNTYTVTGTIKSHDTYKGTKSTMLTRIKGR